MKFLFCVALLVFTSLTPSRAAAPDLAALKAELVQAETEFCAQVGKEGVPAGFLAHIAPDGVLLAAGYGKRGEAVVREQYPENKPGVVLTWKPEIVDVAASGDLGYTTGPWELRLPGKEGGAPTVHTGRYMTIWKRQPNGTWKFVLDGGTEDKPKK